MSLSFPMSRRRCLYFGGTLHIMGAALLFPDHLVGPLCLFSCISRTSQNFRSQSRLLEWVPQTWQPRARRLRFDAGLLPCTFADQGRRRVSWLPASTTFQQRVIQPEYKQCHHGEYWTPKQGLYSMSKTSNQGLQSAHNTPRVFLIPS